MTTHRANDRESPLVADLGARRTAHAVPSVSVRRHRSGRWTVVEVEGEMDIQTLPLVADLPGRNATHVLFELHGVTFLDASGLGMMVDSQRRALEGGGCVRVVAPSRQVRRLLMLTGSDRTFLLFDSLDEAVSVPVDAALGLAS
jgi:anti-sigma B factor antagonist